MTVTINGLNIHYIEQTPPREADITQTVLLLHGWGAPAETYRLIIDHLSSYCRVVAPDLPGFGQSDEPAVPYSPDDFADFVNAFARAVNITEAVVIGHSNGGRIAIKLLTDRACAFKIPKAILMDAAGLKPKRPPSYYLKVYSYKAIKGIVSLPGVRSVFPNGLEKARRAFGSSDYRSASPIMRQTMSLALAEDLTPLLPHISVPTLLIWGEKDTATPLSHGKRMEQLIPDAGLVVLQGAGHFAFAERWGECRRVLDAFLKG